MSIPLYEIADTYRKFLDWGEENETDVEPYLAEIQCSLEEKADNICRIIRCLEAEEKAFSAEVDRLDDLATARRKRARALKEYLKSNLETAGIDKLKAGLFSLAIQASPPSCEVLDENAVPDCFKEKRFVVLKKEIIDIWKRTGEEIPGVVVTQSRHLRIR